VPPPPSLAPLQGLGTSTAAEAKQYFANIATHRKQFVWDGAWHACAISVQRAVQNVFATLSCGCWSIAILWSACLLPSWQPAPAGAWQAGSCPLVLLSTTFPCARRLHAPLSSLSVLAGDKDGLALEMAFSKKKVDDRKQWLQGFVPGTFLDHTADTISYSHFVHKVCVCVCVCGGAVVGPLLSCCRLRLSTGCTAP
jgi:hypothetical protein